MVREADRLAGGEEKLIPSRRKLPHGPGELIRMTAELAYAAEMSARLGK
ncbi:hypothetical protein EDC14_101169 [Hydrogenispora ethanolica]|uniref:Uncharacterized protein n=1 Tax=Hydrogenispora ethanolica TaxID=1082276 RepID=A0A4V2QEZ9_HYDET|nr:hypothetical protein EDC14_101169 [Hydrogenispora ethanolica]